jgi:hypothetical protein
MSGDRKKTKTEKTLFPCGSTQEASERMGQGVLNTWVTSGGRADTRKVHVNVPQWTPKPHELCGTSVEGEDPRNTNDGHQESKRQI